MSRDTWKGPKGAVCTASWLLRSTGPGEEIKAITDLQIDRSVDVPSEIWPNDLVVVASVVPRLYRCSAHVVELALRFVLLYSLPSQNLQRSSFVIFLSL